MKRSVWSSRLQMAIRRGYPNWTRNSTDISYIYQCGISNLFDNRIDNLKNYGRHNDTQQMELTLASVRSLVHADKNRQSKLNLKVNKSYTQSGISKSL